MKKNIWAFSDYTPQLTTPYEFLIKYALQLKEDTNGIIEGDVVEVIQQDKEEVVFALYLVVPELRNYSYRLIEVIQSNAFTPYPVNMKLYGAATQNVVEVNNVSEQNFEKELKDFITSPLTKLILTSLKTHLEIKKEYE